MKKSILIACLLMMGMTAFGQYNAKGFKGGLALGFQNWNGIDRDALIGYTGALLFEQVNENKTSYFMEIGYHTRGSAIRTRFVDQAGNVFNSVAKIKFHNAGIQGGVKKRFSINSGLAPYYLAAARVEYTFADSADVFNNLTNFINKVNYGLSIGGGIEVNIGKAGEIFLEAQVQPDFSQQVYMPPGQYYNRYTLNFQQVAEQRVVNISFELTLGYKILRARYNPYEDENKIQF